jgi:hypothetical protein
MTLTSFSRHLRMIRTIRHCGYRDRLDAYPLALPTSMLDEAGPPSRIVAKNRITRPMNRRLLVQTHLFMESFGGQVTFEIFLGLESEAYWLSCPQQLLVRSF